jgi:hypothetical protein
VLAAVAVAAALPLFGPGGSEPQPGRKLPLTDRVFVGDALAQSAEGVRLGELAQARGEPLREIGGRLAQEERAKHAKVIATGGPPRTATETRAVGAWGGAGVNDRALLHAAVRHLHDDLVLARIELRSGGDRALRRLAARRLRHVQRTLRG